MQSFSDTFLKEDKITAGLYPLIKYVFRENPYAVDAALLGAIMKVLHTIGGCHRSDFAQPYPGLHNCRTAQLPTLLHSDSLGLGGGQIGHIECGVQESSIRLHLIELAGLCACVCVCVQYMGVKSYDDLKQTLQLQKDEGIPDSMWAVIFELKKKASVSCGAGVDSLGDARSNRDVPTHPDAKAALPAATPCSRVATMWCLLLFAGQGVPTHKRARQGQDCYGEADQGKLQRSLGCVQQVL
jgi:hypothetical protein